MKKIIFVVVILTIGYIYLDGYFKRNTVPPLCLVTESELSDSIQEDLDDVSDPYVRIGYNMGETMVMNMRRNACDGRPLTKKIPEQMAYQLKKLQQALRGK